jgi:LacI family transcriptional regulator
MATKPDQDPIPAVCKRWLEDHGTTRKATINDVARLAGVSKKTISRVINESPLVKDATRRDVKAIIAAIGYEPDPQARGLAFRQSFLVGMIYDNPNPQYVVTMQQGILDGLKGSGYELVVHPCDRTHPDFLQDARSFIERQKLFGVVLTPSVSEDERLAAILRDIGCNYVRIASVKLDLDQHMLVSNDRKGAALAGRYLAGLGHTRIGLINGRRGFRSSIERREGFIQGLLDCGVRIDPDLEAEGAYTFESGLEAARKLLAMRNRPTAIFTANDEMAAGAIHACRLAGLAAPRDVSVVGFDDFQISTTTWPQLTTVHSPTLEIGFRAARRLLGRSDDKGAPEAELVPWLVERQSAEPAQKT